MHCISLVKAAMVSRIVSSVWIIWLNIKWITHENLFLMTLHSCSVSVSTSASSLVGCGIRCELVIAWRQAEEIYLRFWSLKLCNTLFNDLCFFLIFLSLLFVSLLSFLLLLFFNLFLFLWDDFTFVELVLLLKPVTEIPNMLLEFKYVVRVSQVCQQFECVEIGRFFSKSNDDFANNRVIVNNVN